MQGTWRMEIDADTTRNIKLQEADHERLCKLATGASEPIKRGWTIPISKLIHQITSMRHTGHSIEPIELK